MCHIANSFSVAIVVSFSQSLYTFAENIGVARPELIFSNPSDTNVTVIVISSNNKATGNYIQDSSF